jgi:short-subunit dehydrogenase
MPPATPGLAVVTGASSGIGAALARRIAAAGRPVLAVARRADRLELLGSEARSAGHAAVHPLAQDLLEPGAPARVARAARDLGGAAWLVNDAGAGAYGAFERLDPARLAAMVRLNCECVVTLTHALLPQLREAGRASGDGAVLVVSSVAGFQPSPWMAVYGATKAFALSFAEGLAEELRGTGVFAGAFCPGPVESEFGAVAGTSDRFRRVPSALTSDEAARRALAQLERRGPVVAVPKALYRLIAGGGRFLPRAAVRRIAGLVQREIG